MSVTINAHQLGRLIDRTIGHIDDEHTEQLHGIRLEADDAFLYAIASDRYTVAAARYRHHGLDGQPFARTIPAAALPSLREWAGARSGDCGITVSVVDDRVRFTAPDSDLGIAVSPSLAFFDWRGILQRVINQSADTDTAFPVLDTRLLDRFRAAEGKVRVRVTADEQAVLIAGEDFLGFQTPVRSRHHGIGTDELASIDQVRATWQASLAAGSAAGMPDGIPAPAKRSSYEVTTDVAETAGELLKQTLRSTHSLIWGDDPSSEVLAAHAIAGVTAWTAYRYLQALHTADPKLAASVVADTADQLDSGEIGEFAWDAAEAAGHDPNTWQDEVDKYLAKAHEKTSTDQPATTSA